MSSFKLFFVCHRRFRIFFSVLASAVFDLRDKSNVRLFSRLSRDGRRHVSIQTDVKIIFSVAQTALLIDVVILYISSDLRRCHIARRSLNAIACAKKKVSCETLRLTTGLSFGRLAFQYQSACIGSVAKQHQLFQSH